MFILNFIPSWFFPLVATIALAIFIISRYIRLPQAQLLHYGSVVVFALSLFLTGANWNNDHWLEKLKEETAKAEQAAKDQELVNQQLDTEQKIY
jgi:hypothetical protein